MKNTMVVLMIASFVVASIGFVSGVSSGFGFNVDAAEVLETDFTEPEESTETEVSVMETVVETAEDTYVSETVESVEVLVTVSSEESTEELIADESTEITEENEPSEVEESEPLEFDVYSEILNGIYVPNFNYGPDGHSVTYFDDEGVQIAVLTDEGVTMNEEAWRMRGIDAYYGFDVSGDVFEQIIGAYDLICAGE